MANITIPLNEANWEQFLSRAQKAGANVRSRYKGVYINKNGRLHYFMARYQGKAGQKYLGRFPLTRDGEQEAFETYAKYVQTLLPEEMPKHPGRIIKSKIKVL